MADYVSIANLAASKIGEDDQLHSPDDDTHLGRTVKAVWNEVRRASIRSHTWNFAMRRKGLASEAIADVPYPWQYSFPLPADNLRLVEVLSFSSRRDYQLEGKSILCNSAGPVYIRYLGDVTEPAQWDDLFVEAMASRLAYQIADRITGDLNRKAAALQDFKAALAAAKRVDGRENPPVQTEATEWETSRFSEGGSEYYDRSTGWA